MWFTHKKLFSLLLSMALMLGVDAYAEEPYALFSQLKKKQPYWRPTIIQYHPDGTPRETLFFEKKKEEYAPMKHLFFYPNGATQKEMDVIEIEESEPGYSIWQATIVPHGVSVSFFNNGNAESIEMYDRGLLHGDVVYFYPDGKKRLSCHFVQGKKGGAHRIRITKMDFLLKKSPIKMERL